MIKLLLQMSHITFHPIQISHATSPHSSGCSYFTICAISTISSISYFIISNISNICTALRSCCLIVWILLAILSVVVELMADLAEIFHSPPPLLRCCFFNVIHDTLDTLILLWASFLVRR